MVEWGGDRPRVEGEVFYKIGRKSDTNRAQIGGANFCDVHFALYLKARMRVSHV